MLFAVIGSSAGKTRGEVMAVYPRHKAFLDQFPRASRAARRPHGAHREEARTRSPQQGQRPRRTALEGVPRDHSPPFFAAMKMLESISAPTDLPWKSCLACARGPSESRSIPSRATRRLPRRARGLRP